MGNLKPSHKNVINERLALMQAKKESVAEKSASRLFLFLLPLIWALGLFVGGFIEPFSTMTFFALCLYAAIFDLFAHLKNRSESVSSVFFPVRSTILLSVTLFAGMINKEAGSGFDHYAAVVSIYSLYFANYLAFTYLKGYIYERFFNKSCEIDELITGLHEVDEKTHQFLKSATHHSDALHFIEEVESQGRNVTNDEYDMISSFNRNARRQDDISADGTYISNSLA